MSNVRLTCLDLFCGAGGLSEGFRMAGFNVVMGVDYDEMALKTFSENHKSSLAVKLDLFDHSNIKKIVDCIRGMCENDIDVLIGGPPCQGFSVAGNRDKNDKRNMLYLAMVKVAEELKPRAIVLENVPGMVQTNGGVGAARITKDFKRIGYVVSSKLLYAPDYGVPQIRKRAFFVGFRDSGIRFVFPEPTCSKENYVTCEDAISDLPSLEGIYGDEVQNYDCDPQTHYQELMREGSDYIYNHIGTIHSQKTLKYLSMIPEGKNYKALPEEYKGLYKYHEALTRYHSKKPSPTINTCHRSHFHYKHNRIPTVRESARLQSFPDTFIFYGSKAEQYRQVGNAVPPLLCYAVAKQVKRYLEQ